MSSIRRTVPWLWNVDLTPNRGCANCKHLFRWTMTCAAYPDGIPWAFQSGDFSHEEPAPGDHGIQWEPAEDAPLGIDPEHVAFAEELLAEERAEERRLREERRLAEEG